MLASFGALGAVAVVVGPRLTQAGAQELPTTTTARIPGHQTQLELFAAMVARSQAVLAVCQGGSRSHEELLLWMEDRESPGILEDSELALISHSRILQTITYHRLDPAHADSTALGEAWRDPGFRQRWRTDPRIESTVLAAGISDLDLETIPLIQGDRPALRIRFTWASDTADGSDEASTLVEVNITKTGRDGDS